MMTGGAIATTANAVIEKGKRVAAMLLQAGDNEIEYRDGKFSVKGSGREVSLFEAAERATELKRQGVIPESLDTQAGIKVPLVVSERLSYRRSGDRSCDRSGRHCFLCRGR